MKAARNRNRNSNAETSARFKEIMQIVKQHDLASGLTPEKTVSLLQDLGPTFVKLGQIASTHPDVLPVEYCEALGALRTKASPLSIEEVKAQIEHELGKPVDELFKEFSEKAAGSASIAQVHRAVLHDGTVVAVKVQRPGIVEKVTNDLAIMERMVGLYNFVSPNDDAMSLKELVDEMVRTSTEELDFANEAANLERFWNNNEPREGVHSPKCYRDLCTSAVLVEDFVSHPCVEDIDDLGLSDEERDKLAYLIANNYMQQIMEDGFYHADPHAGNVLVTPDGIEWIDFGMMGTITASQRNILSELILAMVRGDAYKLKRYMLRIAKPKGAVNHAALLQMNEDMTAQFINVDLDSFDTTELMSQMTDTLRDQGFDVEPFVVNLGRGLVTLEGTIHLVSPRLNIMQVLIEYLGKSFDPNRVKQHVQKFIGQSIDNAEALSVLPTKAVSTLDMVQKGQVRIGMELSANERFSRDLKTAASILSLAFVAMALIIGSCILAISPNAPSVAGMSIAGTVGLALGVALAAYVVAVTRKLLK